MKKLTKEQQVFWDHFKEKPCDLTRNLITSYRYHPRWNTFWRPPQLSEILKKREEIQPFSNNHNYNHGSQLKDVQVLVK
jgi:hypothetical protein